LTIVAVFVGPAGSGKTSLINSYSKWLRTNLFLKTAAVNLDPGAEHMLYEPVFDIRRLFTLRDVMRKYGLGPNGAFLKSSTLIIERLGEILDSPPFKDISEWDMVLIDTPGQMEAFIFRPESNVFFETLKKISNPLLVYVLDASAVQRLMDALTLWFINILIQVKTGLVVVPVVNKIDIAEKPELLKTIIEEPEKILELVKQTDEEGLASNIIPDLLSIIIKTRGALRSVYVSAKEGLGFEEMHSLIHEAFCTCGDLT